MSYLTVIHHSLWGIRTILILLVLSPIFILFLINFSGKNNISLQNSAYYGTRVAGEARYIRGVVVRLNKNDRIATLKTSGNITEDIYVPKTAEFVLKLKGAKGGEIKKISGDYFNRIMVGQTVDIELSGNTVFAQKVLVYDLESFSY